MSVEITRTRQVWDHCVMTRIKVVASKPEEAIKALRLVEEYDAALLAGAEVGAIVERAKRG